MILQRSKKSRKGRTTASAASRAAAHGRPCRGFNAPEEVNQDSIPKKRNKWPAKIKVWFAPGVKQLTQKNSVGYP
jgi:hypothetical protein